MASGPSNRERVEIAHGLFTWRFESGRESEVFLSIQCRRKWGNTERVEATDKGKEGLEKKRTRVIGSGLADLSPSPQQPTVREKEVTKDGTFMSEGEEGHKIEKRGNSST